MKGPKFGGGWSDQKLQVLHDYLARYLMVLRKNPVARNFKLTYVDAFAGCGTREDPSVEPPPLLFETPDDAEEVKSFVATSPRVALELPDTFDRYVFVERNSKYADQLKRTISSVYREREPNCAVITGDANEEVPKFCQSMERMDRAVMFLDPYGAQVDWSTLEAIAASKKVDLWLLFPYTGLLRMLPRERRPDDTWMLRLTRTLGTDDWKDLYVEKETTDLFGNTSTEIAREADASKIMGWVASRLKTIFTEVIEEPLVLRNSRESPLFMLTFAAGNPTGARIACRIAQGIIKAQRRKAS